MMERPLQSAFKEFELLFQRRLRIAEKFETIEEVNLLLEVWDLAQQLGLTSSDLSKNTPPTSPQNSLAPDSNESS